MTPEPSAPSVRYKIEVINGMPQAQTRSGTLVPAWAKVTVPGGAYAVALDVQLVHGAAICSRVEVEQLPDGPPITQTALARIPIARYAKEALAYAAQQASEPDQAGGRRARPEVVASLMADLTPRRKGRAADPEARAQLRREVTRRYEDLVHAGSTRPKPAIADALNISRSYVSALLGEARKLGELSSSVRPSASAGRSTRSTEEGGR